MAAFRAFDGLASPPDSSDAARDSLALSSSSKLNPRAKLAERDRRPRSRARSLFRPSPSPAIRAFARGSPLDCCSRLALSFARELGRDPRAGVLTRDPKAICHPSGAASTSPSPGLVASAAKPHRSVAPSAARLGRPSASTDPRRDPPSHETPRGPPPRACGDPGGSKKPRGAGAPSRLAPRLRPASRELKPRSRDDCWPNRESRDGVTTETLCGVSLGKSTARGVGLATIGLSSRSRADVAMDASKNASSPSGASRRVKTRLSRQCAPTPTCSTARKPAAPWLAELSEKSARAMEGTCTASCVQRSGGSADGGSGTWQCSGLGLVSTKDVLMSSRRRVPRSSLNWISKLAWWPSGTNTWNTTKGCVKPRPRSFAGSFGSASLCPGPPERWYTYPLTDLSYTRRTEEAPGATKQLAVGSFPCEPPVGGAEGGGEGQRARRRGKFVLQARWN